MGARSSLSTTIKDISKIMRNPSLHIQTKGYKAMHDCAIVSLIVMLVPMVFRILLTYITTHSVCTCCNIHVQAKVIQLNHCLFVNNNKQPQAIY